MDRSRSAPSRHHRSGGCSSFVGAGLSGAARSVGSAAVRERDRRVVVERQHVRVDQSICIRSGHRLNVGAFREALSRPGICNSVFACGWGGRANDGVNYS